MRKTLVTGEPSHVTAELIDGRMTMTVTTRDVRVNVQRPDRPPLGSNDIGATLSTTGAAGDLDVTVAFARADVDAPAAESWP